mgnify:CR=1 FL=1
MHLSGTTIILRYRRLFLRNHRLLRLVNRRLNVDISGRTGIIRLNRPAKLNACFVRRAKHGKCFQQPYFGCREFPAFFEYIEDPQTQPALPISETKNYGLMLYDVFDLSREVIDDKDKPSISLFEAKLVGGVMDVPAYADAAVKKLGEG